MRSSRFPTRSLAPSFLLAGLAASMLGCSEADADASGPATGESTSPSTASAAAGSTTPEADGLGAPTPPVHPATSLDEQRAGLLALTFQTFGRMPTNPHVKNRARGQYEVVAACLAVGQPELALAYCERIDNWRRGHGLARVALHHVEAGRVDGVAELLDAAVAVAEQEAEGWRRDRILGHVAATRARLGDLEGASEMMVGLTPSEQVAYHTALATTGDASDMEARLAAVDQAFALGEFELVRNAAWTCIRYVERFGEDADLRDRLEARVTGNWEKLPLQLRIEFCEALSRAALDRGDGAHARTWMKHADAQFQSFHWQPEHRMPIASSLARLRHDLGDTDLAVADLNLMRQVYEEARDGLTDIYRADALVPLAGAYAAVGRTDDALAVLDLAITEAQGNPNGRPRADDLALIVRMVVEEGLVLEPEREANLRAFAQGLNAPW